MRWECYDTFKPYWGHERTVEKFLFFPVSIDGQARWLERTKILQVWGCKENKTVRQYLNKKWLD